MAKRIYFLRHGEADWPNWDKPDDERPLNKKGVKETQRVAKFLRKIGAKPDLILTSPLPRALQTAQIAAQELETPLIQEPELAPCAKPEQLLSLLEKYGVKTPMVVGHEPDFSNMLAALTGARLKIGKSGIARVDVAQPEESEEEHPGGGQGKLIWLIPPKAVNH